MPSVLHKHQLEAALHREHVDVAAGRLKEDNPLDTSDDFREFCEACRRGDLKVCQEKIALGVNLNARNRYDYTPLILASLCGHYEVAQHLLESGALCERDTFQGERCLYNALNDRIRNLLLSYDYSKSTDPLQPLAAHITSLLVRDEPKTSDVTIKTYNACFDLHKFILAARSPYFARKLGSSSAQAPLKLSDAVPTESVEAAIRYVYFGEVGTDIGSGEGARDILSGIAKVGKQLEIDNLLDSILEASDRRLARQQRAEELQRGQRQFAAWFQDNVLQKRFRIETAKAADVKWDRYNATFADVLLQADEPVHERESDDEYALAEREHEQTSGIPIGGFDHHSASAGSHRAERTSYLYPVHRAMLLRSEFFSAMFTSAFREAQSLEHLQVVPIDCRPEVMEIVLTFLYTEKADFGLDIAIEVLFVADLLFIEKLKQRAAMIISSLGNGGASVVESVNPRGATDVEDIIDIYDVIRAGWDTRVHRLEEFGARYIAYRLERFIDDPEFAVLVRDSAARIKARQETDTVELVDDIRYYLSERFRLRFEDSGLDELMDEQADRDTSNEEADVDGQLTAEMEHMQLEGGMGVVRTLDGEIAGDEFAQDAINYQILLGKIDGLLEELKLDA